MTTCDLCSNVFSIESHWFYWSSCVASRPCCDWNKVNGWFLRAHQYWSSRLLYVQSQANKHVQIVLLLAQLSAVWSHFVLKSFYHRLEAAASIQPYIQCVLEMYPRGWINCLKCFYMPVVTSIVVFTCRIHLLAAVFSTDTKAVSEVDSSELKKK